MITSNILFCEEASYEESTKKLDIKGVFTLTKTPSTENQRKRPFSVFIDTMCRNSTNEKRQGRYVYILLKASLESEEERYKLLKEIDLKKDLPSNSSVNHLINIIKFENREILEAPGEYQIKSYVVENKLEEGDSKSKVEQLLKLIDEEEITNVGKQTLVVEN